MRIEFKKLTHRYPSGELALNGIEAVFETSEPLAIIGQNGAGKTTLVKHLNGLLHPTAGELLLDGESIAAHTTAHWSHQIGYVFQNPDNQLFLESVKKELEFGPKQQGIAKKEINARLQVVAELIGLADKLAVHPFDLNATEKKFCAIGSILMMQPAVVILDEPTCGQDAAGNQRLTEIIDFLKKNQQLCITITHDMKFVVQNFEQVMVMAKGQILKMGTKAEIFYDQTTLQASYLTPPPITRVAQALQLDEPVFTQADFAASFARRQQDSKKSLNDK